MLHTDRLTFALLLCRIQLKGSAPDDTLEREFGVFLRGKEGFVSQSAPLEGLTQEQHDAATRLSNRFVGLAFAVQRPTILQRGSLVCSCAGKEGLCLFNKL